METLLIVITYKLSVLRWEGFNFLHVALHMLFFLLL